MNPLTLNQKIRLTFTPFRQPLVDILAQMDTAYAAAASRLGFACCGCEDTCCRSRFYHHTYLEYAYLLEGVERIEPALRDVMRASAAGAAAQYSPNPIDSRIHPLCPLNLKDRCGLYAYRPMICRLHGVPHILKRSGQDPICGPGCETFEQQCGIQNAAPLDRTPLYRQMAELEIKFKKAAGFYQKLKMTIADMILAYDAL